MQNKTSNKWPSNVSIRCWKNLNWLLCMQASRGSTLSLSWMVLALRKSNFSCLHLQFNSQWPEEATWDAYAGPPLTNFNMKEERSSGASLCERIQHPESSSVRQKMVLGSCWIEHGFKSAFCGIYYHTFNKQLFTVSEGKVPFPWKYKMHIV